MVLRFASRTCLLAGAAFLVACQPAGNTANQAAPGNQAADEAPPQVSTEYDVVRAMLDLASVTADDLVMDLGSGDGRIPIMAAREKGARGIGVEIDRNLIRQSDRNAVAAGVADRVSFRQEDLFVTRLNDVSVLTLFLLPEINLQLRPKILLQMRPGARVVSNTWDMGDWRADGQRSIGGTNIYLWVVPARVEGNWQVAQGGQTIPLALTQRYQDLTGQLGGQAIADARLQGDRIAFIAGGRRYEGRVEGDRMSGDGWEATRSGG